MRWPWVSRLAYDAVASERDRLRAANDKLLEQLVRMIRVDRGLTEKPREDRVPDPVPPKIRKLAGQFGSTMTQQDQLSRARRAHAEGMSWEDVEATMLAALNEGG